MNSFQEKLQKAVSGSPNLATSLPPLPTYGKVKPEDVWYDAEDETIPRVSKSAIQRVRNPLPVPVCCPHCGSNVKLMSNAAIYNGTEYGKWPYAYICWGNGCRAYVGCHPNTFIPLGTLANAPMRDARKKAKASFNPLWENDGPMKRTEAYQWLARQLGIKNYEECHIGWFDIQTCQRVVEVCDTYLGVND